MWFFSLSASSVTPRSYNYQVSLAIIYREDNAQDWNIVTNKVNWLVGRDVENGKKPHHSGAESQVHLYNFAPWSFTTLFVLGHFQANFNNSSLPLCLLLLPRYLCFSHPFFILRSLRDEIQSSFSSFHFSEDIQITCHNHEISHGVRLWMELSMLQCLHWSWNWHFEFSVPWELNVPHCF